MDYKELRMLQLEELNMFKEITRICEKYGLTYYALGGTLLGAVRHEGFIPWDDDLDVGFEREDYEKFLKVAEKELSEPYRLLHIHNDEKYIHLFSRVINPNIKLRREYTNNKTVQSLWVDIFPLDGVPSGGVKRFFWEKHLFILRGLRNLSCFDELVDITKEYHGIKKFVVQLGLKTNISNLLNTHKLLLKLDKYLKKWKLADNPCIGNPMGGGWFKEVYPKEYYKRIVKLKFEDTTINCPVAYKKILTQMYGDYMTPPDEKDRNKHGTSIALKK